MIKLNNITKIFTLPDKKLTALDNVSLHVPKGQICGVIGASGAGKSTLIRCVNLLERPTHGAVLIDDVDLTQLSDTELVKTRRQIGMIFQHFNLLTSRTVFENVALPLELENKSKAEIQEKTTALLALVGLSDKHNVYPANLSGGQKQRVAIARALALNPKLIVADEPTSALDVSVRAQVLNLLADLKKELNLAMVFISHDIQTVRQVSDRIVVMYGGQILETGSTEDIFNHPTVDYTRKLLGVAPSLL